MLFLHTNFFARSWLYMDPGTGSMIVQLLLAALLGIGVAVRIFWSRIKTLFGGAKPQNPDLEDDEDGD